VCLITTGSDLDVFVFLIFVSKTLDASRPGERLFLETQFLASCTVYYVCNVLYERTNEK
jgi:hypothetical protein